MASKSTAILHREISPELRKTLTPHRIGRIAEDIAAEFLRSQGHEILFRNWRCKTGELDLVSLEHTVIVITEVKVRLAGSPYSAYASIDHKKQRQLLLVSQQFCAEKKGLTRGRSVRIDAIRISYTLVDHLLCCHLEHMQQALAHLHCHLAKSSFHAHFRTKKSGKR